MYKSVLLLYRYFFIWPGHAGEGLAHGHARLFCRNRFGMKKKKLLRRLRRKKKKKKDDPSTVTIENKKKKKKTRHKKLGCTTIQSGNEEEEEEKKTLFPFQSGPCIFFCYLECNTDKRVVFFYLLLLLLGSFSLSLAPRQKTLVS
jgi:hypothetical protein